MPGTLELSENDLNMLQKALTGMKKHSRLPNKINRKVVYQWFPIYGCCLVAEYTQVGQISLALLFPDEWAHSSYRSKNQENFEYSQPNAESTGLIAFGQVESWLFEKEFDKSFQDLLAKAKDTSTFQRSAANTGRGHQKTPSFISSLVKEALHNIKNAVENKNNTTEFQPLGGTTDVGLHTGGKKRSTSYQLVFHILKFFLGSESTHWRIMALLHLHILESRLNCIEVNKLTQTDVDECSVILKFASNSVLHVHVSLKISVLSEVEQIKLLQSRLENFIKEFVCFNSAKLPYELVNFRPANILPEPNFLKVSVAKDAAEVIEARRNENIGLIALMSKAYDSFDSLLSWIQITISIKSGVNRNQQILFVIRSIEAFIFQRAEHLKENCYAMEVTSIKEVVIEYQQCMNEWLSVSISKSNMHVIEQSHQALVVGIAACLMHKRNCGEFKMLNDYAIPLDWQSLEPLVVKDKVALDALLILKHYLNCASKEKHRVIFSLENCNDTFQFAFDYASANSEIINRWNWECHAAEERKNEYARQLKTKKIELIELRRSLDTELSELEDLECEKEQLVQDGESYHRKQLNKKEIRQKTATISRQAIIVANTPPHFVKNPLPATKSSAITAFTNSWSIPVASQGTSWLSHYVSLEKRKLFQASHFMIYAVPLSMPNSVGASTVDQIHSPCVWHPSNFVNFMFLPCKTNPWKVQRTKILESFTEKLPPTAHKTFKWAIEFPSQSDQKCSRGNTLFTKMDAIPPKFFQKDFQTLSSLRSFPLEQVRKITTQILRDKNFPLDNSDLITLIKQAMYQIGEISESSEFIWKTELFKSDGGEKMLFELKKHSELLIPAPRNYKYLNILADLTSYLGQYIGEDAANLSRKFSKIASDWAKDVRLDSEENPPSSTKALLEMKAKECMFNAYSIFCLSHLPKLNNNDVANICEMLARFFNGRIFANDSSIHQEISMLEVHIQNIMARRISEILLKVTPRIITAAVQSVLGSLTISKTAVWNKYGTSSCFDSDIDGCMYSFNVLTGCLLIDGMPPGRLPESILNNELYKKHFKSRNFQVQKIGSILKTSDPLDDKLYEFALLKSILLIREIDVNTGTTLELIDFNSGHIKWWSELPIRLQKLHSHWYCAEKRALIMRGIEILDKSISHIAFWNNSEVGFCFEVESHDKANTIAELEKKKKDMEYFAYFSAPIFERIELQEFVHTMSTSTGKALVHLPRFNLRFIQSTNNFRFESQQYRNFYLRVDQQLDNFALPFFNQYLILCPSENSSENMKIIVQDGEIGSNLRIKISSNYQEVIHHICFHISPFLRTIVANKVSDRLQLASIFAATGTLARDLAYHLTGGELAIEMIRQSWTGRSLSEVEVKKLKNVVTFAYREPALTVICGHIKYFSERCFYLRGSSVNPVDLSEFDCMVVNATTQFKKTEGLDINPRRHLTTLERIPQLGNPFQKFVSPFMKTVSFSCPAVSENFIHDMEQAQLDLVNFIENEQIGEYPLISPENKSVLDSVVHEELKKSWEKHAIQKNASISAENLTLLVILLDKQKKQASNQYYILENCLIKSFEAQQTEHILLAIANNLPKVTRSDFLRMALDKTLIQKFNPFLIDIEVSDIFCAILTLLQIVVFEERLTRIHRLITANNIPALLKEIFVREWSVENNPTWLVFEVEGELQIRPNQYSVARQLINNPRSIVQLNMGEGKTRVIIPMIVSKCISESQNESNLVPKQSLVIRVNVLTQLFQEAGEHLHSTLTASALGIKFCEFPFHRQIPLNLEKVEIMEELITIMQQNSGFILSAPEHQLSLKLKQQESAKSNLKLADYLTDFAGKIGYYDIIDESDAFLSHKYQMIYAVGIQEKLPQGSERWTVIHAVLHIMNISEKLKKLSADSKFMTYSKLTTTSHFKHIRLSQNISGSTSQERFLKDFCTTLLSELVDNLPEEMKWIDEVAEKYPVFKENVKICTLNLSKEMDSMFKQYDLNETQASQLLMLRGLFGYHLLEHCLSMRHAANYGIDKNRKKRVAVPYTAVDSPSARSEYSHPDVCIILTSLSYYHIGLTGNQLKEAFETLLRRAIGEQKFYYTAWFAQVKTDLNEAQSASIDSIEKIDLTNTTQFATIITVFAKALLVVNFWLEFCVYPTDTKLYSERICASAWDLAAAPKVVGFSGTNDDQYLLPGQVRQTDPDDLVLMGTNGLMLDKILSTVISYRVLNPNSQLFPELADICVELHASALIDTGCILAGTSNQEFANTMRKKLKEHKTDCVKFLGILYFDLSENKWIVLELQTGKRTPELWSPILAKTCFTIFDDARTRGVDKKLEQNATAVLTLGPRLNKGKLMQGAGRMRGLGVNGQKLYLVGSLEVDHSIRQHRIQKDSRRNIDVKEVLNWVLENNKDDLKNGLSQWALQGMHFEACVQNPTKIVVKDDWSLKSLYCSNRKAIKLAESVRRISESRVEKPSAFVDFICTQTAWLGQEVEVSSSQHTEECERELQEEVEEIKEHVQETLSYESIIEEPWDVFQCWTENFLSQSSSKIQRLDSQIFQAFGIIELDNLNWNMGSVFGTKNFFKTVLPTSGRMDAQFLRLIDSFVYYKKHKRILLLSEMEANALLRQIWSRDLQPSDVIYSNLSDVRFSHDNRQIRHPLISFVLIMIMQIFNGETKFSNIEPTDEMMEELKSFTCKRNSKIAIKMLVTARGRETEWGFSQLKKVCERMY
ncbi:hypothetical protein HK100_008218 [Physocladia obscura]|uniref:ubiquitinyl hydrolase 1 n=1 Tax=Physocladia obscura TaxID=109957 RepID=A0AAD5XI16_9FUNG|nr:hypothetical protein HK100_008218 [Physocladia obscura]